MSDMVGKVSVQEKIAELESRIAALEKARIVRTTITEETTTTTIKIPFGEHWNKMWDEFHLAMKDTFKWHT